VLSARVAWHGGGAALFGWSPGVDFPAYFRAGVFGTASWRIPCGLIPPNPWGPLRTGRPGAGPPSFGGVPDSGSGFPCFREGFRN